MKNLKYWMKPIPYLTLIAFIMLGAVTEEIYTTKNQHIASLYQEIDTITQELADTNADLTYLEEQRVFTKTPVFEFALVMADYEDISSYFSNRLYPLKLNTGGTVYKFHPALDITGSEGARTKLIAKARVKHKWYEAGLHYVNGKWREYQGNDEYNGYTVFELLDEWEGWEAGYGHIANITVHEGDIVEAGYEFAIINPEIDAKSTGPHVHFWLKNPAGEYVNPMNYIGKT